MTTFFKKATITSMCSDLTTYLIKNNFDKQLKKHIERFKNKKIIIYGAGKLFEKIVTIYDSGAVLCGEAWKNDT